ncbi:hypothetical protein I4U23_015400 [Adineta vaga]|nr:hypothetical protein I4U23_015400 [Adineta vaga]
MRDNSSTSTIFPIVSSISKNYEIELTGIRLNKNDHIMSSNSNITGEKCSLIMRTLKKFDCLNVETLGSDRILPENRTDSTIINTAMMWMGANMIIPSFASGLLGPALFNLNLYDSFITILVFNLLGAIPVAGIACFGPASGLRTMLVSRYSWGYYGASIMSCINVILSLGWAAVNSITGAQTLRVVFNDTFPVTVGIIIIGLLSMIVSFVGYKWIHIYERYSWIPVFIGYCILAGVGAKYFTISPIVSFNTTITNSPNSRLKLSHVLSFGAACFGISSSWCSCAADYNAYFPEDTSQLKIFLLTYFGNFLSMTPLQLLGAATYTGTYTNSDWKYAYETNNIGGLFGACLSSLGIFGKLILILFALSTISCNIPNNYSLSLSAQVIAPIFKRIPRILYTIIGTIAYVLLAIIAAYRFNDVLISFMSITSYLSVILVVVIFDDHIFFRHCSFKNYNFHIWNNRKELPISLAAILSGMMGVIGIGLGMSQTWLIGPIAKAIVGSDNNSGEGADVGFEFGFLFTGITYPLFRWIELYFIRK